MSEQSKRPEPKSDVPEASTGRAPPKPSELDAALAWLTGELGQGEPPGQRETAESEGADRKLWRRTQWATIRHENAAAEALRAELARKRVRLDADIRDREEWTKARTLNARKLTQAKIDDRRRRTEAEMSGLERRDRTTQVERYLWMVVAAAGLLATIILAFVTAGHSAWEYRVSPALGLALLGGGGLRLWSIDRSRPESPTGHPRDPAPGESSP